MAGQVVGYINKEETAEEIIKDIMEGADKVLGSLCQKFLENKHDEGKPG